VIDSPINLMYAIQVIDLLPMLAIVHAYGISYIARPDDALQQRNLPANAQSRRDSVYKAATRRWKCNG
jgi:hypothetical protein